jgi:predicted RNA-binding Zn ribbon-like protein
MRSAVTGRELPRLGGAACLDFVNTVDPRLEPPQEDFLPDFAALAAWGRYAELLDAGEKRAMLAEGAADPAAAAAIHRRAIDLREALYDIFRAPKRPAAEALATVNAELERTAAVVSFRRRAGKYQLVWRSSTVADRLLGAIAHSAADLLASAELDNVRQCAADGCGWLFLDTSKAHRRRWCSMAICGNRAKARTHRERGAQMKGRPRARRPRRSQPSAVPSAYGERRRIDSAARRDFALETD